MTKFHRRRNFSFSKCNNSQEPSSKSLTNNLPLPLLGQVGVRQTRKKRNSKDFWKNENIRTLSCTQMPGLTQTKMTPTVMRPNCLSFLSMRGLSKLNSVTLKLWAKVCMPTLITKTCQGWATINDQSRQANSQDWSAKGNNSHLQITI